MRPLVHGMLAVALSMTVPARAPQMPAAPPATQGAPTATAPIPLAGQEQPPARVGRVSFVAGQLGFHGKGEAVWSAAAVNYPAATGGSLLTHPKTRAQIPIAAQTVKPSS